MNTKLQYISVSEALSLLQAGKFSVREWTQACLDQINKIEANIKAWAYLDYDAALRQADAVDVSLRSGNWSALSGAPVGIKDIFNTKDMPTQMGSPIWKNFTPGNDARVVHYLRMDGAVIPGKTVTAEFAVHTPGPTRNPHNPKFMAGTSSTGSAVAVAAYMVPMAIGTQTAGSIIRPASYVGVYGFKPSFGIIPRTGMLKTTDSLDTVGFFARAVDDLSLLFEVMRVHGPDFPYVNSLIDNPRLRGKADHPWRVGLIKGPKWRDAEKYAQNALLQYATKLGEYSSISVEEVDLPEIFNQAHDIHSTIYDRTLAYYFKEEFKKQTLISSVMYEIIERGNFISLDQYKNALEQQADLAQKFDQILDNGYDILLNLSTGGEALEGLESMDRPDNSLIWTLCGAPTLSLPVFFGPNDLPFGAQIMARRYNDYLLLNFAKYLQRQELIPVTTNPPPLLDNLAQNN